MKQLPTFVALLAAFVGTLRADEPLSESKRESVIEKARSFQSIARGKVMQVQSSSEIKVTLQTPENSTPDTKKLLETASPQMIEYSLVTDGIQFCGSSNFGGGKRLDTCFNGKKTLMIFYENSKPTNAVERIGAPSNTRPDSNIAAGVMIAYTKYSERQKILDGLLDDSEDTFVVSFLRMADSVVESSDSRVGKVFEAKIESVPLVYSIQLRGADGACTQFKIEGPDSSVWTITNTFSTEDRSRLVMSTRTVKLKEQLVVDATTTFDKIEFIDPRPSLFVLNVDSSTPLRSIK